MTDDHSIAPDKDSPGQKTEVWLALILWYDTLREHFSNSKNCDECIFRGELFLVSYVLTRFFCASSRLRKVECDFGKIWDNDWFSGWNETDLPCLVRNYINKNFFRRTTLYRESFITGRTKGIVATICEKIGYSGGDQEPIVAHLQEFGAFLMHSGVRYVPIEISYMDLFFSRLYEDGWLEKNASRMKSLNGGKMCDIAEPQELKNSDKNMNQAPAEYPRHSKVFLGLAVVAEVLIVLACLVVFAGDTFPYGFYTFLRIVTCTALVGLLLENLSFKWKFPLLLLAILYNPVIPIRLDKQIWFLFNIVTVPMLAGPWIILLRRLRRKDAAPDPKEVS